MLPQLLSERGPLLRYLEGLSQSNSPDIKKAHDEVVAAVRACLGGPDGRIVLELLDICLVRHHLPILDDPRALAARNAQAFILSDLRRILSNEPEQMAQRKNDMAGTDRPGRNRP